MSAPIYGRYRQSGNEWFQPVPSHWTLVKLQRLTDQKRSITYGIVQAGPHIEGGVPYIRPADMHDENGVRDETSLLRTSEEIALAYTRSTVKSGDLVCSIGPSFGKVMVVPPSLDGANLTQGTARVAVAETDHPRFVFWLLRSVHSIAQWDSGIGGATFRALNLEPLARTMVCRPPRVEQAAIAAFLDRETGKIDALVEAQTRLIELLKEKRQAVISHAVTKGLDPAAPMKDSGVEWLGQVPAHWEVVKVVRYFRAAKGREAALLTKEYCSENAGSFPVYSGQTENNGIMGYLDRFEFDAGLEGYLLATTVGAKAMTVSHISGKFSLSQNCMIIRPTNEAALPRFYYYHFQPTFSFHRALIPDHMQASFRMEDLYGFFVALPPLEEQYQISAHLDDTLTQFRSLEAQAVNAIALLQERRAALISAAVTGKIDVCGLVPQQAEAA